ncbi:TolC family protein [Alloprevotella tannerae]|uniref:TolC family protein n=1 Tax=Alloprevotella tannerae TaxID=76122 RepID=UPI0025D6E397|nr:TolC family protein [Alloprevotella tannerae]
MKVLMKTKSKLYYVITILVILMSIVACKTPQATMPQDTLKDSLPTLSKDSSVTISPAWREFFQDPMLQKLIETALQNNQDLKITLQELAIARSAITAKQAALLPSVTANIGAGVSKVGRYTAEGAGNVGTEITPGHKIPTVIPDLAPSLQVDWTIDLWNKLNSGKKAAVERYLASEAGQRAIKSQLVADVAENYYLLLALDYKLSVMQQYISLQKDAVRIAQIQKEADAETQLAVEKFEAELAKAQADEFLLRQSIVETENNLNLLLGRFPQTIQRTKVDFLQLPMPTTAHSLSTQLLLQRPDVIQAEHQLKAAKWDVETARKEFLPSFNISAAIGLNAFNPKYLFKLPESLVFNALGGLTAPLINKKAIQANFAQADALQIEALYNYDKTLLTAFIETSTLQSKISNIKLLQQFKQKQNDALVRAVSVAQKLYLNNRATYLEVIDSERGQLDCKMELIDAKSQQLSTLIEMYSAFF